MYAWKSLRVLSDEDVFLRVEAGYNKCKGEKADALDRAYRYQAIYEALDNPELSIDETTGRLEDDESIYSNTYLPIGAAMVDSARSMLFNHFFSTDEYFEIGASDDEDEPFALLVTAHQMKRHKEMKFKQKIAESLLQCLVYDYGVTMTRWMMRPGYVPKRRTQKTTKTYGGVKLPYQEVFMENQWVPNAVDRSDLVILNFRRCYHDWRAQDGFEDSEFFFDDRDVLIDDLVAQAKTPNRQWGKYKNIDSVLEKMKEDLLTTWVDGEGQVDFKDRKVIVKRCWTPDHVVEWANGQIIRRFNISGWPLQLWRTFERPSRTFEGMGLLQRLERNQYDINAQVNSRRDFQNLVNDPIGVVSKMLLGQEEGAPKLHSGKVYVAPSNVPDVSKLMHIHQPGQDINQGSMQEVSAQIGVMERIAKVSENAQATFSKGRKTATETMAVNQGMMSETSMLALKLEENCLERIYMNLFLLEQANLTREERFKYFGKYGDLSVRVRPEDYRWNALPQFYAKGTMSMVNDQYRLQQFMVAMDRAMAMPQLHNWDEIFVHLWQQLAPKDYHKFIKDPRMPDHNIPPSIENQIMARGQTAEVSPANDHAQHLSVHNRLKGSVDYQLWPERFKMALEQHIQDHMAAQQQASPIGASNPESQDQADPNRGMRISGMQQ